VNATWFCWVCTESLQDGSKSQEGQAVVIPGRLSGHPLPPNAGHVPCRTHMQNIKDITSNIHFEAYRVKRLNEGNSAMANGIEKEPEAQEM
jgi:hypothetical protein